MRRSSLALLLSLIPIRAWACAVCFGQGDNKDLLKGLYLGGALLLACTFGLLGGMVYAIMRLEKARLVEDRRLGLLDS